jgi:hypothetical protein
MAHRQIAEHHVGTGAVPGIQRFYRCPNRYGAIVFQEALSGPAARLLVTPVYFEGDTEDDYRVLSSDKATEGRSDDLMRPAFVASQEEVEALLDDLSRLPEEEPR